MRDLCAASYKLRVNSVLLTQAYSMQNDETSF